MIRFKLKMLIAIAIAAFTSFTMLLYATSESALCDSTSNILCFYVYKDGLTANNMSLPSGKSHFKYYHLISKAQVFSYKFQSTEGSGILRAPVGPHNYTVGDVFRTRRNVYSTASKLNVTFSEKTTKALRLLGRADAQDSVSDKKGLNGSSREEEYIYVRPNLVSLSNNKNLKVPWTDDTFEYYAERQRHLQFECKYQYNLSQVLQVKRVKLNHILIDESRKVLFCYVPKVACTNWKRIFMLLTGKASNISEAIQIPAYKVHLKNLFTSLQNYSADEVKHILRSYTKFIFVRNPFERLLSAYHNKLEQHYESSKYFQARFGKYIIKKFRRNPTNASLERGDDVTFSEFVEYLISSDPSSYNEHWQTVTNLCHPCYINYDLIGKYETLIADSNFVLNYLKLNFSFPALGKPSTTASSLKKYFNALSKDVIYKLYRIYEMDFKLFGYDLFKTLDWSNSS